MSDVIRISRALLSVWDKSDLVPFARALNSRGVTLISTGGTARQIEGAGLPVTRVEEITGFPEGLDGRVKTLHPGVHAGLLARRGDPAHDEFLKRHGIAPIDLVCINLYPFEGAISDPGVSLDDAIEQIDIGGPAMLRAAAKNHERVVVVTSPSHYDTVVREMDANDSGVTHQLRSELAATAFARTAEYDAAISSFLSRRGVTPFPDVLNLRYTRVDELRYGENPHQSAAFYRDPASTGSSMARTRQLHGKPMGYNNIHDGAWALEAVKSLTALENTGVAACVVKHATPCGIAHAPSAPEAVGAAIAGDPLAAYGGVVAVSAPIDDRTADIIAADDRFFEVVIAPGYEGGALERLRRRWATVRLIEVAESPGSSARKLDYRSVPGGMLVQDRDLIAPTPDRWTHAAGPPPSDSQIVAASMLEVGVRYALSNAVVIGGPIDNDAGNGARMYGVGGGQTDRLTACRIAVEKARSNAQPLLDAGLAVGVSDAFFPFDDGPRVLLDAGVRCLVHPGGSRRDDETFRLCDERGVTCLTTGVRRFRH